MQLTLKRPLSFFDIEATGVNIVNDRIVEISVLKLMPDGSKESKTWRVNPGISMSAEVIAIHGITNEEAKTYPPFSELAPQVVQFIKDTDLAGYNSNKFDIPMLAEELLRAGIDIDMKKRFAIDVQNIFHRMEQRTLSAAYKFYCNKDLVDAHTAAADTNATYEILLAQIEQYEELTGDVKFLSEFSNRQRVVDFAGFIALNDKDEEVFTFGKHKNKRVKDVLKSEPGYFNWIQNSEFPLFTKKVLTEIKLKNAFN